MLCYFRLEADSFILSLVYPEQNLRSRHICFSLPPRILSSHNQFSVRGLPEPRTTAMGQPLTRSVGSGSHQASVASHLCIVPTRSRPVDWTWTSHAKNGPYAL